MPSVKVDATPSAMLATCDRMLRTAVLGTDGLWSRSIAFLIRMALERTLAEFWWSTEEGVAASPMRTQLLCLRVYADPDTAGRAGSVWAALSSACHYHGYDLSPTASELRMWYDEVIAIQDLLGTPMALEPAEDRSGTDDVSEADTLSYRRYRYSSEHGGWIDAQRVAARRASRILPEDAARANEISHQRARLSVLARMGKAENDDEREPLRREWRIRSAIIRAAATGDPLPR